MPLDLTDDKSTLAQLMAWRRQATAYYLRQCWTRPILLHDITGPCVTTAIWRGCKSFSQWHHSSQRNLRSHWLKFLWQRHVAIVKQGPGLHLVKVNGFLTTQQTVRIEYIRIILAEVIDANALRITGALWRMPPATDGSLSKRNGNAKLWCITYCYPEYEVEQSERRVIGHLRLSCGIAVLYAYVSCRVTCGCGAVLVDRLSAWTRYFMQRRYNMVNLPSALLLARPWKHMLPHVSSRKI